MVEQNSLESQPTSSWEEEAVEHESLYSVFHFTCAAVSVTSMVGGMRRLLCISSLYQPNCLQRGSLLVYMVKVRGTANRWRGAFILLHVTL